MSLLIAEAIGEVKRLSSADSVSSVGASIVARPPLSEGEITDVVTCADVENRQLVHRPELSNDDRTWFDLKRA